MSDPLEEAFVTPTVRRGLSRALFWIVAVTVVLGVGVVVLVLERATSGTGPALDPESPAPAGALAVAEVLRGEGVDVELLGSLRDLEAAADDDAATVLLHDRNGILDVDQLERVLATGSRIVVLEPGRSELDVLAPGVSTAGGAIPDSAVAAECPLPVAERAGEIRAGGFGYRIVDDEAATGCFPGDDDAVALVETRTAGTDVAILGPGAVLSNDRVDEAGNAALALGLLGAHPTLLWYEPGVDDARDGENAPTLAELTPPWVTPLAVLALLVLLAAGVWRGRRFGPLVVEALPVTVRARETMEGRARLYGRAAARGHSLDALRIGAVGRIASRLGLPRSASVDDVVAAAAALTGRDRRDVERILVAAEPATDAELVDLSDELSRLETQIAAGSRPPGVTERERER